MDKVSLAGMRFFAYHGVLLEERAHGQEFEVDVDLEGDFRLAGHRDDVARTVDYRRAYDIVKTVLQGETKQLLETLAESIGERLLALDRVRAVTVRVRKPTDKFPGPLAYSGVEIHRTCR